MNTERELTELIRRYIDGTASAQDRDALQQTLRHKPSARRLFARYANIDTTLGGGSIILKEPMPTARPVRKRWLPWHPLTAAAAGLALGLFSASLVWGYVGPRAGAASSFWLPVVQGSFENPALPLNIGAAPSFGIWSADKSAVVQAENGITPADQSHMLRVIGSVGKNTRGRPALNGEFVQLIDMRPFKEQFADGCADLKCSAWFNAVADTADQNYTATLEVYAMQGDPSAVSPLVEGRSWLAREQIARSMKRIILDRDPAAWQASGVRVELPPETDFVAVTFRFTSAQAHMNTIPPEFPGHYVDFVRLALVCRARADRTELLPLDSD